MSRTQPASYSPLHIILHWVIAALIFFQLIFGESIRDYGRALRDGTPDAATTFMGNAHIWVGIAVLALSLIRLAVAFTHGVPAPIPGAKLQLVAAKAVHGLLYLLMILVPITGLVAWYGGVHTAGEVHELGKPAFIILIALHIVGAIYHQFVLRDRTLARMVSTRA